MSLDDCAKEFFLLTVGIFRQPRQFSDLRSCYSRLQQDTLALERGIQCVISEQAKKLKDVDETSLKLRSPRDLCKTWVTYSFAFTCGLADQNQRHTCLRLQ